MLLAWSPPEPQFHVHVVRIDPSGSPDHIAHLVLDPFDCGGPVPIDLPLRPQLLINSGPTPRHSRRARNGSVRYHIDCVFRRLTPLQAHPRDELQVLYRSQVQRRPQVDEVCVSRSAHQREVVRVGKQRIEGSDRSVSASSIAGGQIELQPDAWTPTSVLKRVSADRSHGPASNLLTTDSTRLPHHFEIPIDRPSGNLIAHVQIVATLVPAAIQIVRCVRIVPGIISRQLSGADIIALHPETAVLRPSVGVVIEGGAWNVLDGVAPECDETPRRFFPI